MRYLAEVAAGGELGARSALLKYDGTELNKRRQELMMSLAGGRRASISTAMAGRDRTSRKGGCARRAIRSKAERLKIMLDIVAKRLLELPTE